MPSGMRSASLRALSCISSGRWSTIREKSDMVTGGEDGNQAFQFDHHYLIDYHQRRAAAVRLSLGTRQSHDSRAMDRPSPFVLYCTRATLPTASPTITRPTVSLRSRAFGCIARRHESRKKNFYVGKPDLCTTPLRLAFPMCWHRLSCYSTNLLVTVIARSALLSLTM